jgi:hypothetical protein
MAVTVIKSRDGFRYAAVKVRGDEIDWIYPNGGGSLFYRGESQTQDGISWLRGVSLCRDYDPSKPPNYKHWYSPPIAPWFDISSKPKLKKKTSSFAEIEAQLNMKSDQQDNINRYLKTIIIAPMTTKSKDYPTRIPIDFLSKQGQVVLDQIRTVDRFRLIKKLGTISTIESAAVLDVLQRLFAD